MPAAKHYLSAEFWARHLSDRLSEPIHLNLISLLVYAVGGYRAKIDFDLVTPRSHAFGVLRAADFAKALAVRKMYAIEFGVASGAGLMSMARIASSVSQIVDIEIEVVGFDSGEGLPPPRDYRDHPEEYQTGDYPPIDKEGLLASLPSNARVIYGDVADTVDRFVRSISDGVIGFVYVDVDYYWSTVECLKLLLHRPEIYLPITPVFLDDVGNDSHNPWCGELLAVREFNVVNEMRKIAPFTELRSKRIMKRAFWVDRMYALHVLDHPTRSVQDNVTRPPKIWANPYIRETVC
jgi:hypothetical protein